MQSQWASSCLSAFLVFAAVTGLAVGCGGDEPGSSVAAPTVEVVPSIEPAPERDPIAAVPDCPALEARTMTPL